jgi:hypothetical protein
MFDLQNRRTMHEWPLWRVKTRHWEGIVNVRKGPSVSNPPMLQPRNSCSPLWVVWAVLVESAQAATAKFSIIAVGSFGLEADLGCGANIS